METGTKAIPFTTSRSFTPRARDIPGARDAGRPNYVPGQLIVRFRVAFRITARMKLSMNWGAASCVPGCPSWGVSRVLSGGVSVPNAAQQSPRSGTRFRPSRTFSITSMTCPTIPCTPRSRDSRRNSALVLQRDRYRPQSQRRSRVNITTGSIEHHYSP